MQGLLRARTRVLLVAVSLVAFARFGLAQVRNAGAAPERPAASAEAREPTFVYQAAPRTTILAIKPDRANVRKGEVVCELDASPLKDALDNQVIGTEGAKAAYRNARLTREAAELAVKEYRDGIYKQEQANARGAIEIARGELRRAEASLEQTRTLTKQKKAPGGRVEADELAVAKARRTLDQAESKRKTLETFTMPKKLKLLELEVEKAAAIETTRIAAYDRAQQRQDELRTQIDRCKIVAPLSGRVSHRRSDGSGPRFPLERGAMVRTGQFLLRIVPDPARTGEAR